MTGPEQHAATVRDALKTGWRGSVPALAALDELVTLAREGQEYIERHQATLRATEEAIRWTREKLKETGREPIVVTDWKKRAEAAEARADELQRERDKYIRLYENAVVDERKVEAYDAARAQLKREGHSRAEYVLRAFLDWPNLFEADSKDSA